MPDYIPRRDLDFLNWSLNVRDLLTASPQSLGVTPDQAAQYAVLHDSFAEKYRIAIEPSTSTRPSVGAKNSARRALERYARFIVRIIQAAAGVTDVQRYQLNITVRDEHATRVPRPADSPRLLIRDVRGKRVRVRLSTVDVLRRARPRGVAGAAVMSFIGEHPPNDPRQWTYEGNVSKTMFDIVFREAQPGAKVWLMAAWYNPRGERGPMCNPVETRIEFGGQIETQRNVEPVLAKAA